MNNRYTMVLPLVLLLATLTGVGVVAAASISEATPVVISWVEYATHEGESRPHAYMEYRLVKFEATGATVCAQQEVDTGMDAFDSPGIDEITIPLPPPWDLDSVPCYGELEEQTRLVWRTLGEPPLYGVALESQEDRGDGWIAHRTINKPDIPTAVEVASFTVKDQGQIALVEWETASELDLVGFNLICDGVQINEELIPGQAPGTPIGAHYTFSVRHPGSQYLLETVVVDGHAARHGPAEVRYVLFFPLSFQNATLP